MGVPVKAPAVFVDSRRFVYSRSPTLDTFTTEP